MKFFPKRFISCCVRLVITFLMVGTMVAISPLFLCGRLDFFAAGDTSNEFGVSTVDAGKKYSGAHTPYNPDGHDEPTVTITDKIAVTLQYSRKYIDPNGYAPLLISSVRTRKIEFYKINSSHDAQAFAMPLGTKITMIDKSSGSPKYYRYTVKSDSQYEVDLSSFVRMGSSLFYYPNYTQATSQGSHLYIYENFIFIFDFEDIAQSFDSESLHIQAWLCSLDSRGNEVFGQASGSRAGFGIISGESAADMIISLNKETYGTKELAQINAFMSYVTAGGALDPTYSDLEMGIIFSLWKKSDSPAVYDKIAMPKGMSFYCGDEIYKPSDDFFECLVRISPNAFSINTAVKLDWASSGQTISEGNYQIRAQAVYGKDLNFEKHPLTSTKIIDFAIKDEKYSIKAFIPDDERLILGSGVTYSGAKNINLLVTSLKQPLSASNLRLFVYLYKKNKSQEYELVPYQDVFENVNLNSGIAEFALNLQTRKDEPVSTNISLPIKSGDILPGVYRVKTALGLDPDSEYKCSDINNIIVK